MCSSMRRAQLRFQGAGGKLAHSLRQPLARRTSLGVVSAAGGLTLLGVGKAIPHPDKLKTGGEDAFMTLVGSNGYSAAAVADGVSGWAEKGVNAGAYSRVLVHEAREALMAGSGASPQAVMDQSQKNAKVPGSATFVLATLDGSTGVLDVANVGDTGVRVLRDGKWVLTSIQQQHAFDMPFQLACEAFVTAKYDYASDAECLSYTVQEGDWVLLASDGLYDNISDEDLMELVVSTSSKQSDKDAFSSAQELARVLAEEAQKRSLDKKMPTPYATAKAAAKEEKAQFKTPAFMRGKAVGGKIDDITVVAAKVAMSGDALLSAVEAANEVAAKVAKANAEIAKVAIAANAEEAEREQRIRDKMKQREKEFQERLARSK